MPKNESASYTSHEANILVPYTHSTFFRFCTSSHQRTHHGLYKPRSRQSAHANVRKKKNRRIESTVER